MSPLEGRLLALVLCAGPTGLRRREMQRDTGADPETLRRSLKRLRHKGITQVGIGPSSRWVSVEFAPSLARRIADEVAANKRSGWKKHDGGDRAPKPRKAPAELPKAHFRSIFDFAMEAA